jgi:dTDP-4-amino-4,6-dideoxygalactose transaminase
MTFAATANAIRYTGAEPVFVDSQASDDGNVDAAPVARGCADPAGRRGRGRRRRPPSTSIGRCADYGVLEPGLAERGIPLVEDAAESLGAAHERRGRRVLR